MSACSVAAVVRLFERGESLCICVFSPLLRSFDHDDSNGSSAATAGAHTKHCRQEDFASVPAGLALSRAHHNYVTLHWLDNVFS